MTAQSFHDQFVEVFNAQFNRLYRYLDRLSGEPDLAADLAQESFVRLYRRGSLPDVPEAWLIAVAMNLLRNSKSSRSRRLQLLTPGRGERAHSDAPASPHQTAGSDTLGRNVRLALGKLPERERSMLLLRAEGYSYREIAVALELNEASIGVLLARAKRSFRQAYGEPLDAS